MSDEPSSSWPSFGRGLGRGRGRGRGSWLLSAAREPGGIQASPMPRSSDSEVSSSTVSTSSAVFVISDDAMPSGIRVRPLIGELSAPRYHNSVVPQDIPVFTKAEIFSLKHSYEFKAQIVDKIGKYPDLPDFRSRTLISINVCSYGLLSTDDLFVPGEISLVAFNFHGILDSYHTFVDPKDRQLRFFDNYPVVYDTRPKGLRRPGYDPKYQNIARILAEMEAFLTKHKVGDEFAPLICLEDAWTETVWSLCWLYDKRYPKGGAAVIPKETQAPSIPRLQIWSAGRLITRVTQRVVERLLDAGQLIKREMNSQLFRGPWRVNESALVVLGVRASELPLIVPACCRDPFEELKKQKFRFEGKGTPANMLLTGRSFISPAHANDYLTNGLTMPSVLKFCCEHHVKDTQYSQFCTLGLASSIAMDYINVLAFIDSGIESDPEPGDTDDDDITVSGYDFDESEVLSDDETATLYGYPESGSDVCDSEVFDSEALTGYEAELDE